jgi:hypothetical protein
MISTLQSPCGRQVHLHPTGSFPVAHVMRETVVMCKTIHKKTTFGRRELER